MAQKSCPYSYGKSRYDYGQDFRGLELYSPGVLFCTIWDPDLCFYKAWVRSGLISPNKVDNYTLK